MPASISGLVAISEDSGIKPLGYIAWFSVPDESVSLRRLRATLASHGLPPTLAPKDTKAIDTFKRALREQEKREMVFVDGKPIGYDQNTVAVVVETRDDCVYQVSAVRRDLQEREVTYEKGVRVLFNKHTEEVRFDVLGGVPRSELLPIIEAIQDFIEKNSARVTGARVRGVVRNYLRSESDEKREVEGLSGENMRGKAGGVYFILAQFAEQVQALSEMLEELYHGRAYLHAIPLADGATEREMIRRHHIANTVEDMKETLAEARDLLRADRERMPRSDSVAHKWAKFKATQRRAAKYAAALQDEQDEINDMASVLRSQLDKLVG